MSQDFPRGDRQKFNKFLVREYLKYGSVDEVLRLSRQSLPISYANYQKILDKWGIVKAAGPNSKLSEAVDFFYKMVQEQVPLEKLYKKMPASFLTSAVTLYRVLSYIKEGITRRMGTALIIHPMGNDKKILAGIDVSTPRIELGKSYGSISIPMTFSRKRDSREDAILRVLQYEVFSDLAVEKKIPKNIIPPRPKPFMFLDIADVRVEVFEIKLSQKLSGLKCFSSYKLEKFRYLDVNNINRYEKKKEKFRAGIIEAIKGYSKYLDLKRRNLAFNPLQLKSEVNYYLAVKDVV